jgi:protein ImuA
MTANQRIVELRERIRVLEGIQPLGRCMLPFGLAALDRHLPGGGLPLGALHEAFGGRRDPYAAAPTLFVAGMFARQSGPVLWCFERHDLFAPGLAAAGLHPDRVIYAEAGRGSGVLLLMEEGLKHAGLCGVVGEVGNLSLTASRRLQLAAESSGVTVFALRRWLRDDATVHEPNAAMTRWRITALPSAPLRTAGIGRARWQLELLRCRNGEAASWSVEACDAQGCLAVPSDLADGSVAPEWERRHATG